MRRNHFLNKSMICIAFVLMMFTSLLWGQFPQGFEAGAIPTDWSVYNVDGDAKQFVAYNAGAAAQEGTWVAQVGYNASGNDDWLVSPQITVNATNSVLKFFARSTSDTFFEDFNIKLSTTGNQVADFTINHASYLQIPNAWTEYIVDLSAYNGQSVYMAIQLVSLDELTFRVDGFDWVLGNDLAALNISGPSAPTVNTSNNYIVNIKNNGGNAQNNYTVKLFCNDAEVASVAGAAISAGQILPYTFAWTPTAQGNAVLYAKVFCDGDNNPENDQTASLTVTVQPSGTTAITVGNPNTTTSSNSYPVNFYWKNSLSQCLYMGEEINAGGAITSIKYYATLLGDIPADKPLKIWMANTAVSSFEGTSSWIPMDQFTLVFDGTVNLTSTGAYELVIPLSTPFVYGGGNMVIMVNRPMDTAYYGSGNVWKNTSTANFPNRTIYFNSDSVIADPAAPPAGTLAGAVPNTTFIMNTSGFSTLNGTVTSNGNPVNGARVSIDGTSRFAMTNAEGQYEMQYVSPGTVNLTTTKQGYIDQQTTGVVLTEGQTTTQNISITQLPTVTLTGQVNGSNTGAGLANAVVQLTGYDNYEVNTSTNGTFTIPGVYTNQEYSINVTKMGYQPYTSSIIVGTTDMTIPTIVLEANPPIFDVTIGDLQSTVKTVRFPANFNYKNSITQSIYMASELNSVYPLAPGNSISAVKYYVNPTGVIPADKPLKMWMANTDSTTFAGTNGWLPIDQFTLVWDGTVDLSSTETTELLIMLDTPFAYQGQNLVIMVQRPMDENYYQNNNLWNCTDTAAFPNRTLHRESDNDTLEPNAPGAGTLASRIPNTTLTFNTAGLSNLSGFVTTNRTPLNGAKVEIPTINRFALTNNEGYYEILNVTPGTYNITASAHGYFDQTVANVVLSDGQMTTQNFTLNVMPVTNISGQVNSLNGVIAGATVQLTGYDTYETLTGDTGSFSIPSVFMNQIYTLTVTKTGYLTYTAQVNINAENFVIPTVTLALSPIFFSEDFESTSFPPAGWTLIDADQDSYNWQLMTADGVGYNSNRCAVSASYMENVGTLTPDNYLVTPILSLSQNESYTLKFMIAPMDPAYINEHYSLMISTTDNQVSSFTTLHSETLSNPGFVEKSFNLDAYNGQNIYIAFRHHDVSDLFYIKLDNIEISRVNLSETTPVIPQKTALKANYPNPFNPTTTLCFDLKNDSNMSLIIYNAKGQKVKTIANDFYKAGSHQVQWNGKDENGKNVSSGIYFYTMKTDHYTSTRKMILMK
jgi:hypothetical protein